MEYPEAKPEATAIQAEDLLHAGDRAAMARSLSRLACSERLLRVCRGVYIWPIQRCFGLRAPSLEKAISRTVGSLARDHRVVRRRRGQLAEPDNPEHRSTAYLTSSPDQLLHFGGHQVKRLHTPRWQLAAPYGMAGSSFVPLLHGLVPARSSRAWTPSFPRSRGRT